MKIKILLISIFTISYLTLLSPSLYDDLGLESEATLEEIREAIKDKKEGIEKGVYEPDELHYKTQALKFCQDVQSFLLNPEKKAHYDAQLNIYKQDDTHEYEPFDDEFPERRKVLEKYKMDMSHIDLTKTYTSFEDSLIKQRPEFLTDGQMRAISELFNSHRRAYYVMKISEEQSEERTAIYFHKKLGNLRDTLIIIKSDECKTEEFKGKSFIVGGFTDLPWNRYTKQISFNTFLFSVIPAHEDNDEWIAIQHKYKDLDGSMDCCSIYPMYNLGPSFGTSISIHKYYKHSKNSGDYDPKDSCYDLSNLPEGQTNLFGTLTFGVDDYVVYYLPKENNQHEIRI